MDICDCYPRHIEGADVNLQYGYVNSLIGKEIPAQDIKDICLSLDMQIVEEQEQGLRLHVPAYRVDVQRPCDVVEEILRIYGYNNVEIPTQLKGCLVVKGDEDKKHKLANLVSEQLIGCGFREILNNSLTRSAYYENSVAFDSNRLVRIMNPLSSDLNVMRLSLLFGGLESIEYNTKHKNGNLRLFEFGNIYQFDGEKENEKNPISAYREHHHLALWITGKRVENVWIHPDEESSIYELETCVDNILSRVGMPADAVVRKKNCSKFFATGYTIEHRSGTVIAEVGILSKSILKMMDISEPVYYAELDWTALAKMVRKHKTEYREISKYPAVSRCLALLVDNTVEFEQIENIARQTEKSLLKKVVLFDVYEGEKLPKGKKSYAVNLIIQDDSKTLKDKQIDAIMQKMIANLTTKLGAELR